MNRTILDLGTTCHTADAALLEILKLMELLRLETATTKALRFELQLVSEANVDSSADIIADQAEKILALQANVLEKDQQIHHIQALVQTKDMIIERLERNLARVKQEVLKSAEEAVGTLATYMSNAVQLPLLDHVFALERQVMKQDEAIREFRAGVSKFASAQRMMERLSTHELELSDDSVVHTEKANDDLLVELEEATGKIHWLAGELAMKDVVISDLHMDLRYQQQLLKHNAEEAVAESKENDITEEAEAEEAQQADAEDALESDADWEEPTNGDIKSLAEQMQQKLNELANK